MPRAKTDGVRAKEYCKYAIQRNYYYETHDKDGNLTSPETEQEWRCRVIKEWSDLQALQACDIAFIFHDKDIDKDGLPKGLHVHGVITFAKGKPQSQAQILCKCSSEKNCDNARNKVQAYRYLIHVTDAALNAKKHIYAVADVTIIVADGYSLFTLDDAMSGKESKKEQAQALKKSEQALTALLTNVSTGQMILDDVKNSFINDCYNCKWTLKTWYTYKSMFEQCDKEYCESMFKWYQNHNRCLTNIYICGAGGTGKSKLGQALANAIADKRGVHKPASPGEKTTFDFAGNYKAEKVTLFNEFCKAFPVEQFLDVFDPIHASMVNSRNTDKAWFASYGIFTTSRPIEDFLYDIWIPYAKQKIKISERDYHNLTSNADWQKFYETQDADVADKIRQLRRRFAIIIIIDSGQLHISFRNDAHNVPHIFKHFTSTYYDSLSPFLPYKSVPFVLDDDNMMTNAIAEISNAISLYYGVNNLAITPCTVEQPHLA